MSTPTPRTDAAQFDATQVSEEGGAYLVVGVDFARTLETEVTAANARIAELETRDAQWSEKWKASMDVHGAHVIRHTEERESLTRQLSEYQAQLASAREDSARIAKLAKEYANRVLLSGMAQAEFRCRATYENAQKVSEASVKESNTLDALRSAIDSARGVTSPPAVGEKDAWQPIETAPKDGTDILLYLPYRIIEGGAMKAGSWLGHAWTYEPPDESWYNPTHWTALPPPPQGKEKQG